MLILSVKAINPKATKIAGVKLAKVIPKPVKKLCIKNPKECCSFCNLSATKARYGSMAILFAASKIHSKLAAIKIELENGIITNATLEIKAPIRKNGFLRPNFIDHVPSLIAPTIGCKINPVIGPASQSIGKLASSAPKYL